MLLTLPVATPWAGQARTTARGTPACSRHDRIFNVNPERIPYRQLRHVNENTTASRQISHMLELPLDQMALSVLRQALNANADPDIARVVVLRKLAGMYRSKPECELRDALAHAWALYRREQRSKAGPAALRNR